jgi:hypothetical protein
MFLISEFIFKAGVYHGVTRTPPHPQVLFLAPKVEISGGAVLGWNGIVPGS